MATFLSDALPGSLFFKLLGRQKPGSQKDSFHLVHPSDPVVLKEIRNLGAVL